MAHGKDQDNPFVGDAIAALSLFSARRPIVTLSVIALLTVVLGLGVTKIHTNVDVADVLPRGNPNTAAAHNLTSEFKSAFTQQVTLQFHVDVTEVDWRADNTRLPNRQVPPDSQNITDEVYVRAVDQALRFMTTFDGSPFKNHIGTSDFYSLINWTIAGGQRADDSAYSLPGTDPAGERQYRAVHEGVFTAIPDTIDAVCSPTWTHTAVLLLVEPDAAIGSRDIGDWAFRLRDEYVQWAEETPGAYKVFTGDNPPIFTVDLPVANAHSSELTEEDFGRLFPLIGAFIVASLFVAYRNLKAIAIAFLALLIGVLWTYGIMGHLDIALNTLNLTVLPLILGVGIDYAIHLVNEFLEHRSRGDTDEKAFRTAGRRAGLALFIATATTVSGLSLMILSPSLLMAQVGLLAIIAMVSVFLLTFTFVPAALSLAGTKGMGQSFTPSRIMPRLARGVSRHKVVVGVVAVLLTAVTLVTGAGIRTEAFGDPGLHYPPEDSVRREHEQGLKWFYEVDDPDVKANVFVFEGNVLDPAAHQWMRDIETQLKTQDRVISDTLRTLPFLMDTWLTVKDGVPGAGTQLLGEELRARGLPGGQQAHNYPETEQEMRAEFDAIFASPLKTFAALFINHPDDDIAVMIFSVRARTYPEAEQVWGQVWQAVEDAGEPPSGVHVAFVGNTATNYLFIAEELPWLTYVAIGSVATVVLLVALFLRSWRAILAVGLVSFLTSAWWIGVLPFLDIGLAITLLLPMVFIFNLGTDYAVHLIWSIKKVGNPWEVFHTTGKAILFSFITTLGAFVLFTPIQNVPTQRTMIATSVATVIIFITTMLVIPAFYDVRLKAARYVVSRPETLTAGTPRAARGPVAAAAAKPSGPAS